MVTFYRNPQVGILFDTQKKQNNNKKDKSVSSGIKPAEFRSWLYPTLGGGEEGRGVWVLS